MHNMSLWFNCI